MAAFEEKVMASRKKSNVVKNAGDTKRYGISTGAPVSSVEATRINRARKTREAITGAGGRYSSPFDTAKTEEEAYNRTKEEIAKSSGVGGPSGPSALDRYVRTIQGMLRGGDYRQPQDDLMDKLSEMYGGAQTQVTTAMDELDKFFKAQANPYAGFQAQQAQVSPQLTEFLASQGAATDPLRQLAAVRQQEAINQAGAFQNLANTLAQLQTGQMAGRADDVAQQRASMLAALEGARAGYGTQIEKSAFDRQNKLLEMLLAGVAKGGRPNKGALI